MSEFVISINSMTWVYFLLRYYKYWRFYDWENKKDCPFWTAFEV